MAVVKHSQDMTRGWARIISWEGIAEGDTMDEVILPENSERSVQVLGTFGAAGKITIQGSNVPDLTVAEFVGLKDADGVAVSFGPTAGLVKVRENAFRIKPVLSGGDGTTDLTVHLLVRVRG